MKSTMAHLEQIEKRSRPFAARFRRGVRRLDAAFDGAARRVARIGRPLWAFPKQLCVF
jgi:hypothetical protein